MTLQQSRVYQNDPYVKQLCINQSNWTIIVIYKWRHIKPKYCGKNFNVKSKLTHYHFMTQRCPQNDTVYFFLTNKQKKCDCFAESAFSRP